MPVHLRGLVVILVIALAGLLLARRVACGSAIAASDYWRRAALWVALTLAAFLSHNYWLFALFTLPLIAVAGTKDSNRLALYFFVLLAIPPFIAAIPGLGLFGDTLISMTHTRWLSLLLLLPAYLHLRSQPGVTPLGSTAIDRCLLAYLLLRLVLESMNTSMTNLMRIGIGLALDCLLPYYAASRALRDLRAYRDALMSFVVAAVVLGATAIAEFPTHWLFYSGLGEVLGLPFWGGNTLNRGDLLRAQGTSGHPIVLGYLMVVALAFVVYVRPAIRGRLWWLLGFAVLAGALVAALSRGPWVGAAAMFLVLVLTGPKVVVNLLRLFLAALVVVPLLLTTEQGQSVIDYLPFVGTIEAANVEFRQRLFQVSMGVLANFPFFGALDFYLDPAMQDLRGHDGIIDIVNTYLRIALGNGLIGLTLFVAPFLLVAFGTVQALHAQRDKGSELHLLGRCLLAALVGIMVTIGTVSSIGFVPIVYYLVIGLGAGYIRLAASTVPVSSRRQGQQGALPEMATAMHGAKRRVQPYGS